MSDCIFCQINKQLIPSISLYEDDKVNVIMDAFPESKGHVLVITKAHFDDLFEIDEQTLCHVNRIAKQFAHRLMDSLSADGIKIAQFSRACAGQTVFHYHMHIIPAYQNAESVQHVSQAEKSEVLKQIAAQINH